MCREAESSMSEENKDNKWHLDKKVPIAIILTIALQTAGVIWFAAKLESRVTAVEQRTESYWRERDGNRDRLSVLEFTTKSILTTVDRIEKKLDR